MVSDSPNWIFNLWHEKFWNQRMGLRIQRQYRSAIIPVSPICLMLFKQTHATTQWNFPLNLALKLTTFRLKYCFFFATKNFIHSRERMLLHFHAKGILSITRYIFKLSAAEHLIHLKLIGFAKSVAK